jgi:nucleotide-binding universal stress UspA family protein
MLSIRRILHPTDFSDSSKQAFRLACALAHDHRARLIVVHVLPDGMVPLNEMMTPLREEHAEVKRQLEQVQARDPKLRLEHRLLFGDPVVEICRLAKETKAGLIVMGTHGRSGLSRFLMGSVAEQVVRKAACPVLTVRTLIRIVRRRHRSATKA